MDEVPGPSVRLPLLVVLTLLAGLSGLVSWQWYVLEARDRQVQEQSFALAVDDITQRINDRMGAYETALRGMSGVFASSSRFRPRSGSGPSPSCNCRPAIQGLRRWAGAAT